MSGEDQKLDEAMRRADELLVGSLKGEEKRRWWKRIVAVCVAAAGVGIVVVLASRPNHPGAQTTQTTQPAAPAEAGISGEAWARTLSGLTDDNWRRAFEVGRELAELKPETGWSILAENWKKIPSESARQQIIKSFDFAMHPHLLDVLDLGMKDESAKVRSWAIVYLKSVAFCDFGENGAEYDKWRARSLQKTPQEAAAQGAREWVERAKKALAVPEIQELAHFINAVRNDLSRMPAAQKAAKEAGGLELGLRWLTDHANNPDIVRGAGEWLVALKPEERFLQESILPLLEKQQRVEVRVAAVQLLGRSENKWAVEPLLGVLKESVTERKRELIWPAATALSEIGDARAVPVMIGVIAADNSYDTVYGVGYFGLREMTGVSYDEKHDGKWWQAWWEKERGRFPEPVRSLNVPQISKVGAARSDGIANVRPFFAVSDGQESKVEERHAGDKEKMRYFLIVGAKEAAGGKGRRLLVVLPGGDGSDEFRPFVTNIRAQALSEDWVVAELVAPKWREKQEIVWPTEKVRDAKMEFSTERFIDAVVEDVKKVTKIDERFVFALGWSSGGPAVYAAAMREKTPITGAFVAMSVFKPMELPAAKNAKGRAFYLLHSPQDFIAMRFPENAKQVLSKAGAKVELKTYEGGHGWHGDVFGEIRDGVEWLQKSVQAADGATTGPSQ